MIGSRTQTEMRYGRPITVLELFASICHSLGIDRNAGNYTPLDRPVKITDDGHVVKELFSL